MSAEEVRPPFVPANESHVVGTHGFGMAKRAQAMKNERRSMEPVAILSRDFNTVCSTASDPLEITAALEACGWSDSRARTELGRSDVFRVADELFALVPRRLTRANGPEPITTATRLRQLLHGALYVLPGVLTLVVLPNLLGRISGSLLLVALIFGWSTGHTLSYLGFRCLAQNELGAAKQTLRTGAILLGSAWLLVSELFVMAGAVSATAAIFSVLQVWYFLSSTVLQVLRRELQLLACFVPAFAAVLFVWRDAQGLATLFLVISVGLSCVAAFIATNGAEPVRAKTLNSTDVLDAIPYLIYGALSATFVVIAALDWKNGAPVHRQGVTDLVGLPLILSMAASEWQLHRFRHRSSKSLIASSSIEEFHNESRTALFVSIRRYVGVLGLISFAVTCVLINRNDFLVVDLVRIAAFAALGGAFFIALAMVAFGHVRAVVVSGIVILLTMEIVRHSTNMAAASGANFVTFAAATVAWFIALLIISSRNLVDVVGHR